MSSSGLWVTVEHISWNELLILSLLTTLCGFYDLQQRGRIKEEQFIKKVKEMLAEEEKQRIPIAQGLPWTTDEPEVNL